MKDMEDFIITLLKDVNDLLYGKDEESKAEECPSDEYGNTWQSRARRLEDANRTLKNELSDALSRVEAFQAEVARLKEELSKPENVPHVLGEEITEEPAPWSSIRLMDMDGDLWASMTTINGRLWHCETVAWAEPLSFNDLKDTYGPLYLPPHRSK